MNRLEEAYETAKDYAFSIMKETMAQFMCSPLIYKLFVLLELMQMLYYPMHPQISFEFKIVFIEYFKQMISYLQLNFLILEMNNEQLIVIMYTMLGIQLGIYSLIGIGIVFVHRKQKISTFTSYSFKIISFYALISNTFLQICYINVYMVFIICDDKSTYIDATCFSGVFIVHTTFAIFGCLLFFFLTCYFTTLYIELKPTSDVPFAQSQAKSEYAKLLVKILILLFVTIDYEGNHAQLYLILLTILYFLLIVIRFLDPPHFNQDIFKFHLACDSIQFTTALAYTLHKFLDHEGSDDVAFYFIVTALPFMYYCNVQVMQKKNSYIRVMGLKRLSDPNLHEQYFNLLFNIVEHRENQQTYIQLEGLLIQHMESCVSLSCPCKQLREAKQKDQSENLWYRFFVSLLEFSLSKFPKCSKLQIIISYIYIDKLKNKFKCYYALKHLKQLDPSFKEEFYCFKTLHELEELMQEEEQKAEIFVDVRQVVKFQKHYGEFQVRLEESVKRHYEFWEELMETNPDIQKLYLLGSSITQSVEDVKETYEKLIEINPQHINTLKLYGRFQNDVINSDIGSRITEKADQIQKAFSTVSGGAESMSDRYGENSQTCIMTVSAEYSNLGQIQTCNKEIEILGFHKYELVGQNISRIMPKIYANNHEKFMTRYLETNESTIVGIERIVMCLNKTGALLPCSLMFKILPLLGKGIRMVSFIKRVKTEDKFNQQYYILFDPITFQIMGMTQNCADHFGLPVDFAFGNPQASPDFTIDSIIEQQALLHEKVAQLDPANPQTLMLTIDSTKLKDQFLTDNAQEMNYERIVETIDYLKEQLDQIQHQNAQVPQTYSHYSLQQNATAKRVQNQTPLVQDQTDAAYVQSQMQVQALQAQRLQEQQLMIEIAQYQLLLEQKHMELERFKKAQIQCQLSKQAIQDMQLVTMKFTKVDKDGNLQGKSSYYEEKHLKSKSRTKASSETMKKKNQTQHNLADDFLNEDRSSVNSVQSSLNDDMRKLKDFKALMSEKQVPRNIRTIQITVFLLSIILLGLNILDLTYKGQENFVFELQCGTISRTQSRIEEISSVLMETRTLEMVASGLYRNLPKDRSTYLQELYDTIQKRIDYIQELQFDQVQIKVEFRKQGVLLPSAPTFNFSFLLINNQTQAYKLVAVDAVKELVNQVKVLLSLPNITMMYNQSLITHPQQAFYFINYNGLRNIRQGTEDRAQNYIDFFQKQTAEQFTKFLVIMLLCIVVLIMTYIIVIPILLNVDSTNNKVLSMFGLISLDDIKQLSQKCEEFLCNQIEDFKEKRELEKRNLQAEDKKNNLLLSSNVGEKNIFEINNEKDHINDDDKHGYEEVRQDDDDEEEKKRKQEELEKQRIEQEQLERLKQEQEKQKRERERQNRFLKKKDRKKMKYQVQDVELSEQERERVEKLERSTGKQETSQMLKFLAFFVIFVGYFISQMVLQLVFIDNMELIIRHQTLSSQRYFVMMFRVIFGVEDMIQNQSLTINSKWMQKEYHTRIYDVERDVFETYKSFGVTGFKNYKLYYDWMNFGNLCNNVSLFVSLERDLSKEECMRVQNSILEKGLRTSVVNLALYANDTLRVGYNLNQTMNGEVLRNLMLLTKYQKAAFVTLNSLFLNDTVEYLEYEWIIEIVKFVLAILVWVILFLLIWKPYLTKLSKQIWQTKGMLNMIPMSIIQKNEKLKYRFLQDNIIRMVS